MDRNFSCSFCPEPAVRCCLCSTPRVFLCEKCQVTHMSKGQFHSVVPISTPACVTKDNLGEYERKHSAVTKLKGQLEVVSGRLTQERQTLDQVVQGFYKQQTQKLHEACNAVYKDIAALYDRLQADVEKLKREIEEVPVSEKTRKIIERGVHVPHFPVFLDIVQELTNRVGIWTVEVGIDPTIKAWEVIEKWGVEPCTCSDCIEIRTALCGSDNFDRMHWSCPNEPPNKVAGSQPTVQNGLCWICPNCRYEYNQVTSQKCTRCPYEWQLPQTTDALSASDPGHYGYASAELCATCQQAQCMCSSYTSQQTAASTWQCQQCGSQNSALEASCRYCTFLSYPHCRNCQALCEGEYCAQCQAYFAAQTTALAQATAAATNQAYFAAQTTSVAQATAAATNSAPQVTTPGKQQPLGKSPPATQRKESKGPQVYWTCKACTRKNDPMNKQCFCGQPQDMTNAFEMNSIKLNRDRTMWVCKKCNAETGLQVANCSGCGEFNKQIDKAIQGKTSSDCQLF